MQKAKIIKSFLLSLAAVFILDYFLFVGFKIYYIDYLEINEYFNPLFVYNQNPIIFLLASIFFTIILNISKRIFLISIFVSFLLFIIKPISFNLAKLIFEKKASLVIKDKIKKEVIIYESRNYIFTKQETILKTKNIKVIYD